MHNEGMIDESPLKKILESQKSNQENSVMEAIKGHFKKRAFQAGMLKGGLLAPFRTVIFVLSKSPAITCCSHTSKHTDIEHEQG